MNGLEELRIPGAGHCLERALGFAHADGFI